MRDSRHKKKDAAVEKRVLSIREVWELPMKTGRCVFGTAGV